MQHVLGGDGLLANPALGKSHVLGDVLVEMVADHQHIEMLVDGIYGEGPGRIGRGGQYVGLAAEPHNIWRVSAAGTLGVIGVDRPALEGCARGFDKSRLVECVGMDADLHIVVFGHRQAGVYRRRGSTPILVQLEPAGPALDLLDQPRPQRRIALAEKTEVQRPGIGGLQHHADIESARGTGGGVSTCRRARTATEHRGDSRGHGFFDLLGANKMHMCVERPGRQDHLLASYHLGGDADDHPLIDPRHDIRVAGFADSGDAPVLDADIGLVDAGIVEHQRIGNHQIQRLILARSALLAHSIAQDLAAAKLALFAVDGVILLDLDDQVGISQADPVAGGRPVHIRVRAAI